MTDQIKEKIDESLSKARNGLSEVIEWCRRRAREHPRKDLAYSLDEGAGEAFEGLVDLS